MMERLTDKKEADAQRLEYENRLKNGYPRNIPEERFLKLALYEDTELEPEEIDSVFIHGVIEENRRFKELAHAERDGRLVVLPCKVGDTLWTANIKGIGSYTVDNYSVYNGYMVIMASPISPYYSCLMTFEIRQIGEDVFLSRAEAEAALKKREEACKIEIV